MSACREGVLGALDEVESQLGELPELARARVRARAGGAAALAVLGRRGVGKSSLLNALSPREVAAVGHVVDTTRAASAHEIDGVRGLLWVDGPGLRGALEAVSPEAALAPWDPFATLVVVGATEVETGREDLRRAAAYLHARPKRLRRCVIVVNRVDELDPVDDYAPPFRSPRKGIHIAEACARARRALAREGVDAVEVVPVSSVLVREGDAVTFDGRWNLEALRAVLRSLADADAAAQGGRALGRELASIALRYAESRRELSTTPTAPERALVCALLGEEPAPGALARRVFGERGAWVRAVASAARRAGVDALRQRGVQRAGA
ncbi:MAG: GTPase [Polyangiales bacterium]